MSLSLSLSSPISRHHRTLPPAVLAPKTLIIEHPHPRPLSALQLLLILSIFLSTGLLLYFFNTVIFELRRHPTELSPTPTQLRKTPRDPNAEVIY